MKDGCIPRLLQNRITGDYNDFFDFTREDVAPLLEPTRNLLIKIEGKRPKMTSC